MKVWLCSNRCWVGVIRFDNLSFILLMSKLYVTHVFGWLSSLMYVLETHCWTLIHEWLTIVSLMSNLYVSSHVWRIVFSGVCAWDSLQNSHTSIDNILLILLMSKLYVSSRVWTLVIVNVCTLDSRQNTSIVNSSLSYFTAMLVCQPKCSC